MDEDGRSCGGEVRRLKRVVASRAGGLEARRE
jgi:hypothetical protein